jgi:hypothetical protein
VGTATAAEDTENAFALGLVADSTRTAATLDKFSARQILDQARRGMTSLPRLQRPMGMPPAEFERVRQVSQSLIKGAAGEAELYRKDSDFHPAPAGTRPLSLTRDRFARPRWKSPGIWASTSSISDLGRAVDFR